MANDAPVLPRWWRIIPLLLLTTYLGASHLITDVLWMDEWFSYFRSGGGPFEPFSIVKIIQNTITFLSWPPGYFLSLAAWTTTIGGTLLADRLLSLLLGLITVSAMYRLGKRVHSENFGFVAALLLSTSAFFVYYLHELRPYTLYIMAVTLSAWLYWTLLKNPNAGRRIGWGFALSLGLSLYAHYIAALCVFSIAVYHVLFARKDLSREHWIRILRLGVNGCILFTPWVAVMLISVYNETLAARSEPLPLMLYNIAFGFSNGFIWLLALCLLTLRWWQHRAVRFAWVCIITVMGLTVIGNAYADFLFHPRHVLGILPMVMLLLTFTLWQVWQWQPPVAALFVGIWVAAGLLHSLSPLPFMERIPAHQVGIAATANDTIIEIGQSCIASDDFAIYGISSAEESRSYDVPLNNYLVDMEYNFAHLASIVADVEYDSLLYPEAFFELTPSERLQQVTENTDKVWVFSLPNLPIQQELLAMNDLLLDADFTYCGAVVDRPDLLGTVYARNGATCQQIVTSCGGK